VEHQSQETQAYRVINNQIKKRLLLIQKFGASQAHFTAAPSGQTIPLGLINLAAE
jgi:hypothetical protein